MVIANGYIAMFFFFHQVHNVWIAPWFATPQDEPPSLSDFVGAFTTEAPFTMRRWDGNWAIFSTSNVLGRDLYIPSGYD